MNARADVVKFSRSPFLGLLLWLKPRGLDRLLEIISPSGIKAYFAFVEESIAARQKDEEESERLSTDGKEGRQDMFHFLFQATDPDTGKKGYSQQELWAEASLLVVAGSDTTSITLSSFFFYIVRNPRAYQRLVKEIYSTFDSADEIIGGPKLSSCKYLRACVDETLRMSPQFPLSSPELSSPAGKGSMASSIRPASMSAPQNGRTGAAMSTATQTYTAQNGGSWTRRRA